MQIEFGTNIKPSQFFTNNCETERLWLMFSFSNHKTKTCTNENISLKFDNEWLFGFYDFNDNVGTIKKVNLETNFIEFYFHIPS